jgi:hypothetical protein
MSKDYACSPRMSITVSYGLLLRSLFLFSHAKMLLVKRKSALRVITSEAVKNQGEPVEQGIFSNFRIMVD